MTLLAEVADIQTGPFGSQLHKKDYVASGRPIVTVEHLGKRAFTRQNLPFVSEFDAERLKKYQMKHGDVIFSRVGSVDRCSYAEKRNEGWLFSGRCLRIRPKKSIDPEFLYYYLSSKAIKGFVRNIAVGATMPSINTTLMGEIPIPAISLDRQRTIACIMSSLDIKLQANAKLNGYLEELFDSCFKQSLNMVDETWDTASLLDIADYKNGLAMQKFRPNIGDKGLPVLKIRELGQESCGKDAERCRSDIDESVTVHDGDLIFSWSGTLLLRFWAGGDAGLNQHLFKVTSGVYPSWFYYAWTKHHLARFTMLAKDRATTMGHIKRSALEESEVLLPPKEKLAMQTKCMQPIIDQVIANKIEIRKLAALRDALLPKLMSGEIDVSKIDLTQLNSHLTER